MTPLEVSEGESLREVSLNHSAPMVWPAASYAGTHESASSLPGVDLLWLCAYERNVLCRFASQPGCSCVVLYYPLQEDDDIEIDAETLEKTFKTFVTIFYLSSY